MRKSKDQINNTFDIGVDTKIYEEALNQIYKCVALDIDDTITDCTGKVNYKIVREIESLLSRGIIVALITGRGKSLAKQTLGEIISLMEKPCYDNLTDRLFCFSNGGSKLIELQWTAEENFTFKECSIIDRDKKYEFEVFKNFHLEKLKKKLKLTLDYLDEDWENFSIKSNNASGKFNIRFLFELDFKNSEEILTMISEYLIKNNYLNFAVFCGTNSKNLIIEVSIVNKNYAIEYLTENFNLINNEILRIGDQGQLYGNDYEMLDCSTGFSANNRSQKLKSCFPILNQNSNILKNDAATLYLLRHLKFLAPISMTSISKKDYKFRLAKFEQEYTLRESEVRIEMAQKFNTEYFDCETGAVIVNDWEIEIAKKEAPHNIFQSIFYPDDLETERMKKYCLHDQNHLLLRGSLNYYFGLGNRTLTSLSNEDIDTMCNEFLIFLEICYQELDIIAVENHNSVLTQKVILAILDNIRNMLLIWMNSIIEIECGNEEAVLEITDKPLTSLLTNVLDLMYTLSLKSTVIDMEHKNDAMILINQVQYYYKSTYKSFLKESLDETYNFKKGFRIWRETDNFLENVIAIEEAGIVLNDSTSLFGLRYGSLELPILANVLLNRKSKEKINYKKYIVSLSTTYKSLHDKTKNNCLNELNIIGEKPYSKQNILFEDNILTGKTIDHTLNFLINSDITINKIIVVRFPSLNRVNHMFLDEGHGVPNLDIIGTYIKGLTSSSPYSKLLRDSLKELKYTDELGVFDLTRNKIEQLLYKNGLYNNFSTLSKRFSDISFV